MSWKIFLAEKYLRSPAKRGIRLVLRLAVFGVALGVATLTLTQSVMSGFEKVFRESILGFNAHLVLLKQGEMEDIPAEEKAIQAKLGADYRGGTPFLYREGLLVAKGRVKGAVLKGIDPLTFNRVYAVKVRPFSRTQVPAKIEDLLKTDKGLPALVLGSDLAKELEVEGLGSTLKIFLPKRGAEKGGEENFRTFEVTGVFSTGLYEYDHGFAFVDLQTLQGLLEAEGRASGIEMVIRDPAAAEAIAENLEAGLSPAYQAVSWQRLNGPLFSALHKERLMFLIIMAMVVAVASFNIVGVLLLMIFDKAREISILRSLGATVGGLQRVFAYQGLAIGAVGGILGIGLGAGIAWLVQRTEWLKLEKEVYLVERLPVEWSPEVALTVGAVTLAVTLVASLVGVSRLKRSGLDL
ncbi:MAG TPA: ABC transporter permease [bacterium]|nr:ABC transporter permease [bacterium]